MSILGKYNFPNIRRAGAAALNAVLASTTWGAWLLASPFKPAVELLEQDLSQYLANEGLLLIDLGAILVEGKFDQSAFDKAMDDALERVKIPGLSDAQKKTIDDKVIQAFRNFGRVTSPP